MPSAKADSDMKGAGLRWPEGQLYPFLLGPALCEGQVYLKASSTRST